MIHTGQHFDEKMSTVFFRELDMPEPRYNLGIASLSQGAMTGRMMEAIEQVLIDEKPDAVLVYGDTNSTVAGAMAAVKLHIPVAHVEAGLRSFNRRMPEEINRIVTDHIASIQFCPTSTSIENLRREGITENVFHTGDVMYDATLFAINAIQGKHTVVDRLELELGEYDVCTIHRAENTDDPAQLAAVAEFLRARAKTRTLVLPLHPRTRGALAAAGLDLAPALVIDPLGYFDLHALLAGANSVLTDSGGLQKEAYFHGKPCITLRDETEWVELIDNGWNRLWRDESGERPRVSIGDYGNGDAAENIAGLLANFLK